MHPIITFEGSISRSETLHPRDTLVLEVTAAPIYLPLMMCVRS